MFLSSLFMRQAINRFLPKAPMTDALKRFACTVKENPWGYKEDRWKVPILFESRTEIAPDTYKLRFSEDDIFYFLLKLFLQDSRSPTVPWEPS